MARSVSLYASAITDYYKSGAKEREVTSYGVNYWPTENVVLKADVQNVKNDNDAINLGFGYQF
jgi:hypothetical protein